MPEDWEVGKWELLKDAQGKDLDSNVTAIHAHLLPDGKILYFHARYPGDGANFTSFVFDPSNNSMSQRIIIVWNLPDDPIEPSALFCSGHTFLADGTLLVAGGERTRPPVMFRGIKYSFYWNGTQLLPKSKMNKGRWYPQLTRLPNGKVVAMSGYKFESQTIELTPEIFDPVTGLWTEIDVSGEPPVYLPLYNGAYIIPFGLYAGEIFYDLVAWENAMSQGMRFNPSDSVNIHWNTYGGTGYPRAHGNSCMLPIKNSDLNARIINLSKKISLQNPYNASMIEIGNNLDPMWVNIPNMTHDRHDAPNFLLLADGAAVVFGGGDSGNTVLTPEKLDYSDLNPANWTWSQMKNASVRRKYHSTALLMKDARVWTGGSRLFPERNEYEDDMERRIEIYSPGYLFDGTRPVITNAPNTINYGADFEVSYAGVDLVTNIDSVVLISLPSVTHCFDANQKYVILDFESFGGAGTLNVHPPANANIAQPGPYMLFLLRKKSESTSGTNRIPSIAQIVSLQ